MRHLQRRAVRRVLTMSLFVVCGMFVTSPPVSAVQNPFNRTWDLIQQETAPSAGVQPAGQAGYRSLDVLVGSLIQSALSILGLLFFVYVVYGGYLWMTAHGSTDQIEKAKKVLIHGVIGLVIVVAAYAIAAFVISRLEDSATGIFQ